MASLNLSGNNNNYYKIQAGDTEGSWILTLPSQNDTLATIADVKELGSPWSFIGTTDVTRTAPFAPSTGDAYVNKVAGQPDGSWKGLAPSREIPVDALLVVDEGGGWHELSSSEIDPIYQASPAANINQVDIDNWDKAFKWEDHADAGYLTEEIANGLGYNDYKESEWAEATTIAKIPLWDDAYSWGDHNDMHYLVEELDPVFLASPAANIVTKDIENWNEAHGWGNHATKGYLTEVKTLGSIGDVNVPTPKDDEVLTAVVNGTNVEWQSKKVNVIVEGELLFKGPVDATSEGPKELPAAVGHLYVNTYDPDNPYEENNTNGEWKGVTKVKYGDKLAYGDDDDWHVIGNAGIGTDLSSFSVVNDSTNPVEGGSLSYDEDTGVFTYTKTDALTESQTLFLLSSKAEKDKVYTKDETYAKGEIDLLLKDKADAGVSYTKAEADAMIQEIRQNESIFLNKNSVGDGFIQPGWNGISAGPMDVYGDVDLQGDAAWTITGGGAGGAIDTGVFDLEATPMYAELRAVKKKAEKVAALEEEVQELKGMVKQLIKGIK